MIFDHNFPAFENRKNRGGLFVCQDVDPRETGELISECKDIETVSIRSRFDFATKVAINAKEVSGSCVNDVVKRLASLLAENAFRAIAVQVFDADETKAVPRCVCETFVHELGMG